MLHAEALFNRLSESQPSSGSVNKILQYYTILKCFPEIYTYIYKGKIRMTIWLQIKHCLLKYQPETESKNDVKWLLNKL